MKISNTPLVIKAVTWSRDSHGLYDYESRNVQKKQITTSQSCSLIRADGEVRSSTENISIDEQSFICHVRPDLNNYLISPESEPIWLVTRTMKTKHGPGAILNEGQVLKLGRVCFKVLMMRTANDEDESDKTQDSEDFEIVIPNEREAGTCRICLSNDSDSYNPLISPCKCSGSMKYIHLSCLRYWMNSRKVIRTTDNCVSFSWKTIDCEICKSEIPFSLSGKDSEIVRIEKPKPPFIVLEGVGNDKNGNKGVHVVGFTGGNSVILGRGHEADVRVSDISVSRCHAVVRYVDGCFVVEDKNSKFGTLVSSEEMVKVGVSSNVVVQIGRTVISFSTKELECNDIPN